MEGHYKVKRRLCTVHAARQIVGALKAMQRVRRALEKRQVQEMEKAAKTISRWYKGRLLRRWACDKTFVATLCWPSPSNSARNVVVIGNFTQPPWRARINMKYNPVLRAYTADVKIKESQVFKFIANGVYRVSRDYETIFDASGNENNIFLINSNYKQDAKSLLLPFRSGKVYAVQGNSKKLLVTCPQEPVLPFSVYDAQSGINAHGSVRHILKPEEIHEAGEAKPQPTSPLSIVPELSTPTVPEPSEELKSELNAELKGEFKGEIKEKAEEKPKEKPNKMPREETKEESKGESKEEFKEESRNPHKPFGTLVRVATALNLSESIDKIEASNGPILLHDDEIEDNSNNDNRTEKVAVAAASSNKSSKSNPAANNNDNKLPASTSRESPRAKVDPRPKVGTNISPISNGNSSRAHNGVHNGGSPSSKQTTQSARPVESWRMPIPQWNKCKTVTCPKEEKKQDIPLTARRKSKKELVPKTERKDPHKALETKTEEDELVMKPVERKGISGLGIYRIGENTPEIRGPIKGVPLFKFVLGYSMRPKDDSEGEDACFACERGLGVADGVSGWSAYGINPSAFSQKLMEECENAIRQITGLRREEFVGIRRNRVPRTASYVGLMFQASPAADEGTGHGSDGEDTSELDGDTSLLKRNKQIYEVPINSMQVLSDSYDKVAEIGSSTATVVALNGNEIEAVNLGDSGFIHLSRKLKEYEIVGVSKEQQHEFNVPFQLSRHPTADYLASMASDGRTKEVKQLKLMLESNKMCKDNPEAADQYNQEVAENDIVVLGTDGLFDNLFGGEMLSIIKDCMKDAGKVSPALAKKVSDKLVSAAYKKSRMLVVDTPFKRKLEKVENKTWECGKEDDITVVVGIVKPYYF